MCVMIKVTRAPRVCARVSTGFHSFKWDFKTFLFSFFELKTLWMNDLWHENAFKSFSLFIPDNLNINPIYLILSGKKNHNNDDDNNKQQTDNRVKIKNYIIILNRNIFAWKNKKNDSCNLFFLNWKNHKVANLKKKNLFIYLLSIASHIASFLLLCLPR